jgi:hypothetical protein
LIQWYDDRPEDPAEAFVWFEELFRKQFLTEPLTEAGMMEYMLRVVTAKRELEQYEIGLLIPLDLFCGCDHEEIESYIRARYEKEGAYVFEIFRQAVQSAALPRVRVSKDPAEIFVLFEERVRKQFLAKTTSLNGMWAYVSSLLDAKRKLAERGFYIRLDWDGPFDLNRFQGFQLRLQLVLHALKKQISGGSRESRSHARSCR